MHGGQGKNLVKFGGINRLDRPIKPKKALTPGMFHEMSYHMVRVTVFGQDSDTDCHIWGRIRHK